MEFGFTQEQEALRSSVREVLSARSTDAVVRAASEASASGVDEELWRTVRSLGWTGVAIEESSGGLGLGLLELVIIMEEIGRAIAPVPFLSTALAGSVLAELPASPARDRLLRAIAAGEQTVVFACDARDATFDVIVGARESGDGWVLEGTASFVLDAHVADELIVPARAGEQVALFAVDARTANAEPLPSLDGTRRLARVSFDALALDADRCLARDATDAVERSLDRAALLVAAEAVGVCDAVLERSVGYARERAQFDRPIGSFQAISHRCADMMLAVETARSHTYYGAWALEEAAPDARAAVASAKAAAADAARVVAGGGIQVHGGIGFTWEHEMHLFYRRAKFCELWLGAAGPWRERVMQQLLV